MRKDPIIRRAASRTVTIWIAGDFDAARAALRRFCFAEGACFALEPVAFIYSGGEEAGVRVTLINYPRFPKAPEELDALAERLAPYLREALAQGSLTIQTPEISTFLSWREMDKEA